MANFKKWRVAFTVTAVAFLCFFILYGGLTQKEPAVRSFTMLLGFICGIIPASLTILMPRFLNILLTLFLYFLAMILFLAGGIAFANSDLWIRGVFGASTEIVTFQVILWHFFPAFLLSTIAVEGVRYYTQFKRVSSSPIPDGEEEEVE